MCAFIYQQDFKKKILFLSNALIHLTNVKMKHFSGDKKDGGFYCTHLTN